MERPEPAERRPQPRRGPDRPLARVVRAVRRPRERGVGGGGFVGRVTVLKGTEGGGASVVVGCGRLLPHEARRRPRAISPMTARRLLVSVSLVSPLRWLQRLEKKRDRAGQWALAWKLMAPASNTVERPRV